MRPVCKADNLPPSCAVVMKSVNLNFMEPYGPLQACNGTALPFFTWLSTVHLEKLTGLQLVKKFPAFYGTRRFITALTSARHLSLSWASSIQSIPPHSTSLRCILTLSSHLRLGLSTGLFPAGFPHQNPVHVSPLPIHATCPAHLIECNILEYKM